MNIRKLSVCVIAVLAVSFAVAGNKNKPEREVMKLSGKVKSLTEVEFSGEKKDTLSKNVTTFNEAGYETYGARYISGGKLFSLHTGDFTNTNNLKMAVDYQYSGGKKPTSKQVMLYDAKGYLGAAVWFNPPGMNFDRKEIYFNDARGNIIEQFDSLKEDGKYLSKIFKYNSKDSLTEMDTYSQDDADKFTNTMIVKYNDNGCRIEATDYSLPDSGMSRDVYTCDANNNRLVDLQYMGTVDEKTKVKTVTLDAKITYTYDAKGNMTEKDEYNDKGTLQDKEVVTYDEHNSVISDMMYGADGKVSAKHLYQYDYDLQGNWTKRTESNDSGVQHTYERYIQYF